MNPVQRLEALLVTVQRNRQKPRERGGPPERSRPSVSAMPDDFPEIVMEISNSGLPASPEFDLPSETALPSIANPFGPPPHGTERENALDAEGLKLRPKSTPPLPISVEGDLPSLKSSPAPEESSRDSASPWMPPPRGTDSVLPEPAAQAQPWSRPPMRALDEDRDVRAIGGAEGGPEEPRVFRPLSVAGPNQPIARAVSDHAAVRYTFGEIMRAALELRPK